MTLNDLAEKLIDWAENYSKSIGYSTEWFVFLAQILMIALICGVILGFIAVAGMFLIWMERKISAHMQSRVGPKRVGPYGILQSIADAIKLLQKENIVAKNVDRPVYWLAPIVVAIPAVMSFVVFPFHQGWIVQDMNLGLLYLLGIGSVTVIGIFMAGYSSYNKYSLIGAMRTVAQIITYEIPAVLAVLVIVMQVGSLSMVTIIESQKQIWYIFYPWGLVSFLIYLTAATAETNRIPFDIPEAESELVAGYHTEYTGMKFALFFIAEYTNMVIVCMIASSLFLGGWNGPFGVSPVWMALKVFLLIFLLMWFRWTFPRLRVDQMMTFGWKILLPVSFINIALVGLWMIFKGN